jgi:cytochrome c peroxidase
LSAVLLTLLLATNPFQLPKGLQDQPLEIPADNPMTPGKIKLGEQLFFDARLSKTKKMACLTCHLPEKGWTDGLPLSPKFDGSLNTRHTPTLMGAGYYPDLYWDGRAKGLEAQILAAWKSQMGAVPDEIAAELAAIPKYKAQFEKEMGGAPSGDLIVKALATFVRTLHAGDTAYDKLAGNPKKFEDSDIGKGFKVFTEVANCSLCHAPPVFTDFAFHNVGIGFDTVTPDNGRGKFLTDAAAKTKAPVPAEAAQMMGAFKTPSLRGIALTAPYFHDGRAKSLEEAVDLMLAGGVKNEKLDEKLKPVTLLPEQRKHLLAFLKALSPPVQKYKKPKLP